MVPEIIIPLECSKLREIGKVLVDNNFVASANELKRLINQGGVSINKEKVSNFEDAQIESGDIIKLGKKKFVKVVK